MWAARARNRALLSPLSSLHIARPPSPKTIAHTTLSLRLPRRGWHWSASVGQGDWAGRRASACTQPARNLTPENKWARNARTLTLTLLPRRTSATAIEHLARVDEPRARPSPTCTPTTVVVLRPSLGVPLPGYRTGYSMSRFGVDLWKGLPPG
uniref:Uncharacterized protein n=1 Tax=Oryza nivara TaxID=4536 RepID=A0A0E0GXU4_ORYNI